MPLDPTFQLRLDAFEIDDDTLAARSEIWRLLKPELPRILDRHIEKLYRYTPYFHGLLDKSGQEFRAQVAHYMERYYTRPFDEQWIATPRKEPRRRRASASTCANGTRSRRRS